MERTFIAIKPDGVQRGLIGEIIKRFERKGFKLVAMKFMHVSGSILHWLFYWGTVVTEDKSGTYVLSNSRQKDPFFDKAAWYFGVFPITHKT